MTNDFKPPVIYAGYLKTATTWLHNAIIPNHPQIEILPDKPFAIQVIYEHDLVFDPIPFRRKYQEYAAQIGDKHPYIAFEALAGDPWSGGHDVLRNADRLKAIYPNAKIVLVIREQINAIDSLYRQYLRAGGTMGIHTFLEQGYPIRVRFAREYLLYHKTIAHYIERFGRDSVFLYCYEMIKEDQRAYLEELFNFVGVPSIDLPDVVTEKRVNRGLANQTLQILRLMNRFVYGRHEHRFVIPPSIATYRTTKHIAQRYLDPIILSVFDNTRRNVIPDVVIQELREFYQEGNRELVEEHNLPLERLGYSV